MAKLWIPDFSEHQGKINWGKLKVPGVIIRVGYGDDLKSQDDVYAKYNLSEAKRLGIPYAVYLYSYACKDSQIQSEIAHTKRLCKGYDPVYFILDIEEWGNRSFSKRAAEAWLKAFQNGIVYAGQAYWKDPLKGMKCKKWVPAYGKNSGKREDAYKPKVDGMVGWQFTSRYSLAGVSGNVDMSEFYIDFGKAEAVELRGERRVVTKKEVAAIIMRHMCTHRDHGYTQDMKKRWGSGTEEIDIYGHKFTIAGGDRDCSSAVISAYEAAGISCGGATYTGNMKECMLKTGNFRWRPMSFIAQTGDSYLNEECHTAMCMSAEPDILGEFSINEKGGVLGGKTGDQKQSGEYDEKLGRGESHLAEYYDYGKHGWDGILECVNNEIAFVVEEEPEKSGNEKKLTAELSAKVILGYYGNSPERRERLGERYDSVQKVVTDVLRNHKEELAAVMAEYIERIE